ncbi:MAG: glycosyltransferase family 2 protein [Candidatus Paceibacterota bacterium]
MKLSIIIPTYNEERTIQRIIEKINALNISIEKEIIVIDDGSNDKTWKILSEFATQQDIKLVRHPKNLGKGAAVRTGLRKATGNLAIIQDADLEYDPQEILKLLPQMNTKISAVYGQRSTEIWPKRGYHYVLGAQIMTKIINFLYASRLKDIYTGYKLFNLDILRESFAKLKSSGFEFEAEVTCEILNKKGIIVETPINYTPRSKEEGKKIKFKDAVFGFFMILRCFLKN